MATAPTTVSGYERRMADVNWRHGSLVTPPTPDAPSSIGDDESIGALLDEAEDIINAAVPDVRAEVDAERAERLRREQRGGWWRRGPFRRREA